MRSVRGQRVRKGTDSIGYEQNNYGETTRAGISDGCDKRRQIEKV